VRIAYIVNELFCHVILVVLTLCFHYRQAPQQQLFCCFLVSEGRSHAYLFSHSLTMQPSKQLKLMPTFPGIGVTSVTVLSYENQRTKSPDVRIALGIASNLVYMITYRWLISGARSLGADCKLDPPVTSI